MSIPLLAKLAHIGLNFGERVILHDVSLEVYPQSILTLIGPNGAGKSTVLKILLGLQQPDQGTVWRMPGLRVGYVPQKFHLDRLLPLTVERFIGLNLRRPDAAAVRQSAEEVGVQDLLP